MAKVRFKEKISPAFANLVKPIEPKPNNFQGRASLGFEGNVGEFYYIAIEKLIPFKNQARSHFDEEGIKSMAQSIKDHGIRLPLTILPAEQDGLYEIVSGERRYRAAKLVGLVSVPCFIINDRRKANEIALIENIQRKDLHPVELMRAYRHLLDEGVCSSMQDIAYKFGEQKSAIVEILNLYKLPVEVQDLLIQKGITKRNLLRRLCKNPLISLEILFGTQDSDVNHDSNSKYKRKLLTIDLKDDQLSVVQNITLLSDEVKLKLSNCLNSIIAELGK